MTTFHESQPQSRRAARQSEREEGIGQADFTGEHPEGPQVYSAEGRADDIVDESRGDGAPAAPKGRRAAAPAGPPSTVAEHTESTAGEELPATQAIQQPERPAYRVRDYSPEGRRSVPQPSPSWITPTVAPPAHGGSHVVDDAPTVTASDATPPSAQRAQFYVPESALQDTIVPTASRAVDVSDSVASDAASTDASRGEPEPSVATATPMLPVPEHTMTRRELRALEAQREAASKAPPLLPEFAPDGSLTGAAAAIFVETDFSDDADQVVSSGDSASAGADAGVSADDLLPSTHGSEAPPTLIEPGTSAGGLDEVAVDDAAAIDDVHFAAPALTPFDALFQVPPAEPTIAPVGLVPSRLVPPAGDSESSQAVDSHPDGPADPISIAPNAQAGVELDEAIAEFDSLTREPGDEEAPQVESAFAPAGVADSSWIPPIGHWSAQDEVGEDDMSSGNVSRTVGSGISTTSALVLPSIPEGADIRGPLTGTGEIRLTGSIDLPRTLSSTGQSDRFDGERIDALFDLSDAEVISTDSSPVRAIRAVSTHNSGHGVTHTQKPKGTKALTGLLIAASSLAVVVAGLLVAAFAFNVF